MSIFDRFPHSTLHEMNLDWIIRKIQEIDSRSPEVIVTDSPVFCAPEQFGAVGDGVYDDTQAFINAILSGKIIVGVAGKTYKIGTISLPKSATFFRCNFTTDSSNNIKEVFLVNRDNLEIYFYGCTFVAPMNRNAVTFPDEHPSSNVLFYHNNGTTSRMFALCCDISGCEYCFKSETGRMSIYNCKMYNSMMPIFTNNTAIEMHECYLESVATNALYHPVYLHPSVKSEFDGHVSNCEFVGEMGTLFQCYNNDDLGYEISNVYVDGCTFRTHSGELSGAYSYGNFKLHFNNCRLTVRYKGYFDNCECVMKGLIEDVTIRNSRVLFDTGMQFTGKLAISDSDITMREVGSYLINMSGDSVSTILFERSNVNVETTTNNTIRLNNDNAVVTLRQNYIYRDIDLRKSITNRVKGTVKIIDNLYNIRANDVEVAGNRPYNPEV